MRRLRSNSVRKARCGVDVQGPGSREGTRTVSSSAMANDVKLLMHCLSFFLLRGLAYHTRPNAPNLARSHLSLGVVFYSFFLFSPAFTPHALRASESTRKRATRDWSCMYAFPSSRARRSARANTKYHNAMRCVRRCDLTPRSSSVINAVLYVNQGRQLVKYTK